jgi:hypothetical protein
MEALTEIISDFFNSIDPNRTSGDGLAYRMASLASLSGRRGQLFRDAPVTDC